MTTHRVNIAWESMSPMNVSCEYTIVIPRLLSLFRLASAASSTVELLHSASSDYDNLFNFAM